MSTTPGSPDNDYKYLYGYLPLWPYADSADAEQTMREHPDPWRLDAGAVGQRFTQQYLGFADIGKIVNVRNEDEHAWVHIGFDNPNGRPLVAAGLHLMRYGADETAPWEVVDTDDTTLTLTTPAYGAVVSSPISVGGLISGVDESLRIQVRQLNHPQPVGAVSGIPAGGTDAPWQASVPFAVDGPAVLTVIVSTGGHIAGTERFAIIGVRC